MTSADWLDWSQRCCAAGTARQRGVVVRSFLRLTGVDPAAATRADVDRWWTSLDVCASSRGSYLAQLRQLYRWMQRRDLRLDDPTVMLDSPRRPRRLPRPVSSAELQRALVLTSGDVRVWFLLAAHCGLRCCEIARLHPADIDRDSARPTLFVRQGKGGDARLIPLDASTLEALEGYSWPAVTPKQVSQTGRATLHRVGVKASMHRLRHYFGTWTYRSSKDPKYTQQVMGHASSATTDIYTSADMGEGWTIAAAVAALVDV